ncbi:MAG: hypothetical protein QOH32_238 [Bradyrhizobium sp.]|nr:hypothetical protein [Bradyrhizobium sp.]
MTIRFIGAMAGGVLLGLSATTGALAQTGGWTPPASASSAVIAEHVATVRAEILFGKCKQHYSVVVDGIVWPAAPNSRFAACMRNGGRRI